MTMRGGTAALVVIIALVMVLSSFGRVNAGSTVSPTLSPSANQVGAPTQQSVAASSEPKYTASGLTVKGNFMPWVCQFCTWSGSNASFATEYNPYASNITQLSTEMYYLSSACTDWFCSRGYEDTSNDLTQWDHAHGVRPLPMITTCTISVLQSFLGTSSDWAGFISTAVSTAQKYGYGGYNIDWEPDTSCASGTTTAQNGYELAHFIDQFANASHVDGMIITLDFAYWDTLFWNTAALAKTTGDTFMEMNYQCPGSGFTDNLALDVKNIGVAKLGEGIDPESGCTDAQMVTEIGQVEAAHVTNIEWWALDDNATGDDAGLDNAHLWTAVHDFVYENAYNGTTNQTYSAGAWGLNTNEHPTSSGGNLYLFTLGRDEQGYEDAAITGTTTITSINITQQVFLNPANYRIYEGNLTATGSIQSSWQLPDVNTTLHLGAPGGASAVVSVFFELATAPGGTVGGYLAGLPGTHAYFSVQINGGSASTLSSVAVSPISPTVSEGGQQAFTATPTCSSTCPGTITYVWALTSSTLGSLSGSDATDTFTAGTTAGTVGMYVNATLNSTTVSTSTIITVASSTITLTGVTLSPTTPTVASGSQTVFTATPQCTPSCPSSGITYIWALTSTNLGSLSGAGTADTFTAGTTAGTVGIYVNATYNSALAVAFTVITVNGPTLNSVSVSPTSPSVAFGSKTAFTSTPSCTPSCPTSGFAYTWALTSSSLGSLSGSGASVNFTALTTAGTVGIFVNASLGTAKVVTNTVITVKASPVTLNSVAISPVAPSVTSGSTTPFKATPTCSATCPTPELTYAWTLSNPALGSLTGSGASVTFVAGTTSGTMGIFVNVTLNGTVQGTSTVIAVAGSSSIVLASVSITPISVSVATGDSQTFVTGTTCTGGACPSTMSYAWTMNNTLGTISPTGTGASAQFTAGNNAGNVTITVSATLNGKTVYASATVNITPASGTGGGGGLFSNTFTWLLIAVAVVVIAAVIAVAMRRKKEPADVSQLPEWPQPVQPGPEGNMPPAYPPQ
jgi:hypothetical protein